MPTPQAKRNPLPTGVVERQGVRITGNRWKDSGHL